jgi:hypothetical protein
MPVIVIDHAEGVLDPHSTAAKRFYSNPVLIGGFELFAAVPAGAFTSSFCRPSRQAAARAADAKPAKHVRLSRRTPANHASPSSRLFRFRRVRRRSVLGTRAWLVADVCAAAPAGASERRVNSSETRHEDQINGRVEFGYGRVPVGPSLSMTGFSEAAMAVSKCVFWKRRRGGTASYFPRITWKLYRSFGPAPTK